MYWLTPGILVFLTPIGFAAEAFSSDSQTTVVELYVRNDSESCRQAVAVVRDLEKAREGLRLVIRDVLADQESLRSYWRLATRHRIDKPVMPGVSCRVQFRVGFSNAAVFRSELEEILTIRVYTREGCPHCRGSKRFLAELVLRRPALRVTIYDVEPNSPFHKRNRATRNRSRLVTSSHVQ